MTALLAAALGISLSACADRAQIRSLDGAKAAFEAPPYAVRGKTQYDQNWIDGQVEAGVGALGWQRPKPRPPSLDAKPSPATAPVAPPPKKRLRDRFLSPFTG